MNRVDSRRAFGAFLMGGAATALASRPAPARTLPQPTGPVILTVSGQIGVLNAPGAAVFDRAMLEALGTSSLTTSTPWYDGRSTFEGVLMTTLMGAVEAKGETVTALALNDYTTDIPVSDFASYGVLLALKRDGAYMPTRDKGPLFIVYPYDSSPELRTRRFYSRSAWQLSRLIVK